MDSVNKHIIEIMSISTDGSVSGYDESFLNNCIQKRVAETGCSTIEEYIDILDFSKQERNLLFESLHISYSSFFRNPLTFGILEKIILPGLFEQRKNTKNNQIRVWSAACAAGQEPYSLAMLFEELATCNERNNCYRIFATDRDEHQIELAKKGHYHASNLDNMSLKFINKWFRRLGEIYTLKPELKKQIEFSVFDLFDDNFNSPPSSIFGGFDIVLCANLLFYYKADYRRTILEKIARSMTKNGLLITGETERDIVLNYNFKEVYPQSAIFSLKSTFK
jgi:chemotaxis methyl-accepting protein methylase